MIPNNDIEHIGAIAQLLCSRGWADGPEGNLSIRVSLEAYYEVAQIAILDHVALPLACPNLSGQVMLVSNSGSRFRDIAIDPLAHCSLLRIDESGKSYTRWNISGGHGSDRKPTSELSTHLLVQQLLLTHRDEQTVLLHAHVNDLIAMSLHPSLQSRDMFVQALMNIHPEMPVYYPSGIGFVPLLDAGTMEIAEATAKEFLIYDIVMWQRHGVLAIGRDIDEAYDRIAIAAKAAALYLSCVQAGFF